MNTDMKKTKVTNLLSMAARARRIASGAFAVEEAAKKGKAKFLLIAEDCEPASQKKYETLSDTYGIPAGRFLTREELGACLGKEYRAAAVLLDDGFAKKLQALLERNPCRTLPHAGRARRLPRQGVSGGGCAAR